MLTRAKKRGTRSNVAAGYGSPNQAFNPGGRGKIRRVVRQFGIAQAAALSVGGRDFAIQKERGKLLPLAGDRQLLVTVHPSYLLRVPEMDRQAEFLRFVRDLRLVA